MGMRSFRMRQGVAIRRALGVGLAVGGVLVLLYTAPPWIWSTMIGIALTGAGWYVFHLK